MRFEKIECKKRVEKKEKERKEKRDTFEVISDLRKR